MQIDITEVRRIAQLARLHLTPDEEAQLAAHFEKILTYVAKLDELTTTTVEPTAHAIDVPTPFREDIVSNAPNSTALLANTPDRVDHLIKVPKIID